MKDYDKTEDYLNGKLGGEEKAAFEERLKNEPELQEQVKLQRGVNQYLAEKKRRDALTSAVKEAGRSYHGSKSIKPFGAGSLWKAAVLIGIVLTTTVILFYYGSGLSNRFVLAEEFTPYLPGLNTRNSDSTSHWEDCFILFENTNFKGSLECFDSNPTPDSMLTWKMFVSGQSWLALNDPAKAQGCFAKIDQSEEALLLQEHIDWYLALSLAALDSIPEAIQRLKKLSTESDFYRKKADALKLKLEKQ
jgi:hypothetical protein